MKELDINEVHSILLEMAKEFHRICTKHSIPYYMLGGTMLGAVRHKGFIPWDDDMDFGIPREHYERFVKIAEKELPGRYKMLTYQNSDYAVLGMGKLVDVSTLLIETYSVKTEEKLGIFLDVFPLDYTDEKIGFLSTNWKMRQLFKLQKLLFVETTNRPFHKKVLANMAQLLIPLKKQSILAYIHKKMLRRETEPRLIINLFGAWGMKEAVSVNIMNGKTGPVLYNFEGTQFYGPSDYDAYLRQLYGNYMQLPPVEERHIHSENFYSLD